MRTDAKRMKAATEIIERLDASVERLKAECADLRFKLTCALATIETHKMTIATLREQMRLDREER